MSSFGEELRRERELRQITLREISEATKINLRYLDALERNDFARLPGGVFNKGFVRAFAQYIGVDPETMVNAYLLEERGQLSNRAEGLSGEVFRPSTGSAVRPHTEPDRPEAGAGRGVLVRAAVVALAVVVLGSAAVLVWWWWSGRSEATPARHGSSEAVTPESVAVPAEPGEKADDLEIAGPGPSPAGVPEVRVVVGRATQGRVNCDNRRVEILDGLAGGTEMVFRCRDFLLIDALDGGAVLVQHAGTEATALGPDGVPVVGRYVVPPKQGRDAEEPS